MSKQINVVIVEPNRPARAASISNSLESMHEIVGGYIELVYPFTGEDEDVCCVCNEGGKINGLALNRAIYDEDDCMADIVAGTFFTCDASGEDLDSLSPAQLERFTERYKRPEMFCRINGQIVAIPYDAEK